MQHVRRWAGQWPVTLVVALVVISDQVTKYAVRDNLSLGESWPRGWAVRFTHVENTGSAFGLFTDQTVFLIAASIVAIGIVFYMFRSTGSSSPLLRMSLAMMLGGGVSNLVDRVRYGEVTDFIDFQFWPIFNIADSSVVVGITILAFFVLFRDKPATAQQEQSGAARDSAQPLE